MVQTLARCRSCGLPAKLAERLEWRNGGVIVFSRMKSIRLAMVDEQTTERIHRAISAEVGEDALMSVEKESTRIVTSGLLAGIKGRLTRYGAIKKRALEGMEEYSLLLGMGRIEIERFTPGVEGILNLHRPFDLSITAAGVTGVLEEMDRCRYQADISAAGENSHRLELRIIESSDTGADSLQDPSGYQHRKGGEKQKGCSQCGLPQSVAQMIWDELYGVVVAGVGGRRVALVPAYMLAAFARLGNDVAGDRRSGLVEGAVYSSTRISLEGGTSDAYESADLLPHNGDARAAWQSMRMRGWGEVVGASLQGKEWGIDVSDPVDIGLIAGWLRALYAATTGEEAVAVIEEGKGSTTFRLV
jgi:hypothetical protein